jgi:hypothetical protein
MPAKEEQAITWCNPAAQTHPVLDSSSFAPILTFPCRTCLHYDSSVLAVHISCRIITVFVFRKPVVSCNRGRSWNVLPADMGAHMYMLS